MSNQILANQIKIWLDKHDIKKSNMNKSNINKSNINIKYQQIKSSLICKTWLDEPDIKDLVDLAVVGGDVEDQLEIW